MLGRKDFTPEEIAAGKATVERGLRSYRALADAVADGKGEAVLQELEPEFFNDLLLALDRFYVHRVRMVTGKDGTPLNELELLADALMNNGGVLRGSTVITYLPEESVTQLRVGDRIRLTADDFQRLATAVFEELEQKFR